MPPIPRLFAYGFPGKYGGAGTELHHQIALWLALGIEVHLIPSNPFYQQEPLYPSLIASGVVIHTCNEWDSLSATDIVLGFCNAEFLEFLPDIHQRTRKTVFINCMTWLFEKEKQRMAEGLIGFCLYQNEVIRQKQMPILRALNGDPKIQFLAFRPYFDDSAFPFIEKRSDEFFGCGRISRQDSDKFAANTLHIYEYFVAPQMKRAIFLGFDQRSEAKIGRPFPWITTALV